MDRFLRIVISRFSLVLTIVLLMVGLGISQYISAPKKLNPDINIPFLAVSVAERGASANDIYRQLLVPIRNEVTSIEGLDKTYEYASRNSGVVVLQFKIGTDEQKAYSDLQSAVSAARSDLPSDLDSPVISRFDPIGGDPEITVSLSKGQADDQTFYRLTRNLSRNLRALNSVETVDIRGLGVPVAAIFMDPSRMATYGLSPADIENAVASHGSIAGSGPLHGSQDGDVNVLIANSYENLNDLRDIPIRTTRAGTLRLADIADIRYEGGALDETARFNGRKSISVDVVRKTGTDSAGMVANVKKEVEAFAHNFTDYGITYNYVNDASDVTAELMDNLVNTVIIAVLLVLVTVSATLSLRASLLVGISIPISFLGGLAVFFMAGGDINFMTIFGLVLAVGLLVDAALVITEYGERHIQSGLRPETAYVEAVKFMAAPLASSTLTTLFAFLPLFFWPGIAGEFMKNLPVSTFYILIVSYFVAIIVVPSFGVKMAYFIKSRQKENRGLSQEELEKRRHQEEELDESRPHDLKELLGDASKAMRYYMQMLFFCLKYPKRFLLMVLGIIVGSIVFFVLLGRPVVFFPDMDSSQVNITVYAQSNYSLDQKDIFLQEILGKITDKYPKIIENVYSRTSRDRDQLGRIRLYLISPSLRSQTDKDFSADVRALIETYPGAQISVMTEGGGGPPKNADVEVGFGSSDPKLLDIFSEKMRTYLEARPDIANIKLNNALGNGIELAYDLDAAKLKALGIPPISIGTSLLMASQGFKVGTIIPQGNDESFDITLQAPRSWRTPEMTGMIPVFSPVTKTWVPINAVAKPYYRPAVDEVSGRDGLITYTYLLDVKPGVVADAAEADIRKWMSQNLPEGIQERLSENAESMQETIDYVVGAFLLAQFLILVVLVAQYNNLFYTAITFSAVFMSFGGLFLGLLLTGSSYILVMTTLALFTLSGVIVNNNIVLISTYQQARTIYPTIYEAIVITCFYRIKPVLLTAITSSISLVPSMLNLSFNLSEGRINANAPTSAFFNNLSISIGSGLIFGTILTLFVTPALLMNHEMGLLRKQEKREKKQNRKQAEATA